MKRRHKVFFTEVPQCYRYILKYYICSFHLPANELSFLPLNGSHQLPYLNQIIGKISLNIKQRGVHCYACEVCQPLQKVSSHCCSQLHLKSYLPNSCFHLCVRFHCISFQTNRLNYYTLFCMTRQYLNCWV